MKAIQVKRALQSAINSVAQQPGKLCHASQYRFYQKSQIYL